MSSPFEFHYKPEDYLSFSKLFKKLNTLIKENTVFCEMPRLEVESYEIKAIESIQRFLTNDWCRYTAELEFHDQIPPLLDFIEKNKNAFNNYSISLSGGIKYGITYGYLDKNIYKRPGTSHFIEERLEISFDNFEVEKDLIHIIGYVLSGLQGELGIEENIEDFVQKFYNAEYKYGKFAGAETEKYAFTSRGFESSGAGPAKPMHLIILSKENKSLKPLYEKLLKTNKEHKSIEFRCSSNFKTVKKLWVGPFFRKTAWCSEQTQKADSIINNLKKYMKQLKILQVWWPQIKWKATDADAYYESFIRLTNYKKELELKLAIDKRMPQDKVEQITKLVEQHLNIKF